ncbi:hypothetical protein BKA60DRAFT_630889 [Fusarium oxysporum]|nr:hypothetical protein BKA60DRAFT_630889 [Fusarium oxysporum]
MAPSPFAAMLAITGVVPARLASHSSTMHNLLPKRTQLYLPCREVTLEQPILSIMEQADASTHLTKVLFLLCWCLLNLPDYQHPCYKHVCSNFATRGSLLKLAGLSCPSQLSDMLSMATPPSLVQLKSLPDEAPRGLWGVYLLVFEKPGCLPAIYVGSGTASQGGVRTRLLSHRSGNTAVPFGVQRAKDDGYTLTHTSLLISCLIPLPMHRPQLAEGSTEGLGFTPEQLEAIAEERRERGLVYQEKYRKEHPEYHKEYQKSLRANPTPEFRARNNRNNVKQQPGTKLRQQQAVANKTYYCPVCKVACRDHAGLVRHNNTPKHHKKTLMGDSDYICGPCDISFKYLSAYKIHCRSKGHLERTQY